MTQQQPEIIIIGAGLVGTSLACALAPYFKIQLFEKNLPDTVTSTITDDRPISLAYGSQQILQTLGIWSALQAHALPIKKVMVCEQATLGGVNFQAADYALPALGFVVSFNQLQHALYQTAAQSPNVTIGAAPAVAQMLATDAPLVIACDGSYSMVRDYLHIRAQRVDHQQQATIFKITLEGEHDATAYERFTTQGVLALLPMPHKNQLQCVWTHNKNIIPDGDYIKTVFKGYIPNAMRLIEQKLSYPLQTITVAEPIRERLVLMGNAAHTVYPLAAQGFNLGLRDAAALSEVLVNAKLQHQNWGSKAILQRYLAWRLPDQQRTMRLTNGLVSIFEMSLPLVKPLRGLAMLAIDCLPPLKKRLAKRTMGLSGQQPKLMLGVQLNE